MRRHSSAWHRLHDAALAERGDELAMQKRAQESVPLEALAIADGTALCGTEVPGPMPGTPPVQIVFDLPAHDRRKEREARGLHGVQTGDFD